MCVYASKYFFYYKNKQIVGRVKRTHWPAQSLSPPLSLSLSLSLSHACELIIYLFDKVDWDHKQINRFRQLVKLSCLKNYKIPRTQNIAHRIPG